MWEEMSCLKPGGGVRCVGKNELSQAGRRCKACGKRQRAVTSVYTSQPNRLGHKPVCTYVDKAPCMV